MLRNSRRRPIGTLERADTSVGPAQEFPIRAQAAGAPDWAQLSRPAAENTGNIRRIIEPLAWSDLDLDSDSRAGGGDSSTNHVTAAVANNRSLIVAYTPAATTLNVDLKRLAGPGMAQWIDPASSQARGPAVSVENTGTGLFTTRVSTPTKRPIGA